MTRTIIIPLSDPQQDEEGIAEQALICTEMLVGSGDVRILLVSAINDETLRPERQAYLDHLAGTVGGDVETVVAVGEPATTVLDIAEGADDPIIVMASHGRRGVRLRVLGSVAASVARGARCPVMILPASPTSQAPICKRIERVLLPIYDAAIAEGLVDETINQLGARQAAGIEFFLVDVSVPIAPQPAVVAGDRYQGASEVPAHFLRRIAASMQERGYQATWDVRIGDPSREIVRIAGEKGINLIVMPANTRSGFNSLVPEIFGAQLHEDEPVPVLLVHPALGQD